MEIFLEVFSGITLPIIALIGMGYVLQPYLKLHISSFNRFLMFVVVPSFFIHYLSTTEIPLTEAWPTVWYTPLQMLILGFVGWFIASLLKMPPHLRVLFGLVAAMSNTGNYSVPLIKSAFPPEFILHQTIIFAISAIVMFGFVVWLISDKSVSRPSFFASIWSTPMVPSIIVGLFINASGLTLPEFVTRPLGLLGQAFIPLALFTLGAQLSHANGKVPKSQLSLAVFLKLILAPAITWGLVYMFGFAPMHGDMLVVSASAPAAIVLVVLQSEFGKSEDPFLGQAIFITTVLSPIFVTGWIILTRIF